MSVDPVYREELLRKGNTSVASGVFVLVLGMTLFALSFVGEGETRTYMDTETGVHRTETPRPPIRPSQQGSARYGGAIFAALGIVGIFIGIDQKKRAAS